MFLTALPFFYFMFVASITPGPNNVMLTASGMNFGFKRTIPHILGIVVGFNILIILCALGVGAIYEAYPGFEKYLKIFGSCYLLYLAYKILMAGRIGLDKAAEKAKRPFKFIESLGFQFVNPKSIVFGISALSLLPADLPVHLYFLSITTSGVICAVCSATMWTLLGKIIAELFRAPKTRWFINIMLVLLLIGTLPMIWL